MAIKVNAKDGELQCRGPLEQILFEFTLLTRVLIKELREQFGDEMTQELMSGLGQIAAKHSEKAVDPEELFDDVSEVLGDEI